MVDRLSSVDVYRKSTGRSPEAM